MFDNLPAPMVAGFPGPACGRCSSRGCRSHHRRCRQARQRDRTGAVGAGLTDSSRLVLPEPAQQTGRVRARFVRISWPVACSCPTMLRGRAGCGRPAQQHFGTRETPAKPNQAVTIFGTAFGPTQTPVPEVSLCFQLVVVVPQGVAGGANRILARARIMIGPQMVEPLFVGLSPDSPHLYQANAVVPSNAQTGCSVPVKAIIDGVESNRDYILHARCASLMAWRSGATSKPAHSRVLEDSSARLPFWRDCSHSSSRWLGW